MFSAQTVPLKSFSFEKSVKVSLLKGVWESPEGGLLMLPQFCHHQVILGGSLGWKSSRTL